MAQRRTTQPLNYLRINKDGLLYKKSDEATYNESKALGQTHIHKSVSKDGKQTYYHDVFTGGTEEGYLEFLGIKDFEFEGKKVKQLVISVKGEEETDVINFPLYNTTGGLNLYVKHLACILPNLDFSRKINIVPSTKKNDRGYVIQNVFINYVDDDTNSFVELAHKYGDKGDIPPADTVTGVDGTEKKDYTKQDTYLYNILKTQIEKFKEFKGVNHTEEDDYDKPNQPVTQKETIPEVDEDDLPF